MTDLTGIHDSDICSCVQCLEVAQWERSRVPASAEREYEDWSLQADLTNFRARYGEMALLGVLDRFWQEERGMEH